MRTNRSPVMKGVLFATWLTSLAFATAQLEAQSRDAGDSNQEIDRDRPPARSGGMLWSDAEQTAVGHVDEIADQIRMMNRKLWEFAEVGLQETRSAQLLVDQLKQSGFEVETGIGDIPTAFVATYGAGKPVIGILAEYDALPGLSQNTVPYRAPRVDGEPGHGCGHSGLGSGAVGAAIAARIAIEKHQLPGTIRLYGTPAEETVIGKVYMLLSGEFRDLDVCLHWHPSSRNEVWSGSSKALVSAKFTFHGTAAHAAGSPESGRSALDAVELMNVGVNFMREHVKEDARLHYVITNGGGAPNVVPATATVWYYVRADRHEDVEAYFEWLQDIARGAALMTRTRMSMQIDTDCHELIANQPLSEMLYSNLNRIEAPQFTEQEEQFARRLQEPLVEQFGTRFPLAIDRRIHPLSESSRPSKGSTDVGDISWFVPTAGIRTTCFVAESPGHSWQNVACIGSTIGEKGILYASRVLAMSTIQLLENPQLIRDARTDWEQRMSDRKYTSLIPENQKPPRQIR